MGTVEDVDHVAEADEETIAVFNLRWLRLLLLLLGGLSAGNRICGVVTIGIKSGGLQAIGMQ